MAAILNDSSNSLQNILLNNAYLLSITFHAKMGSIKDRNCMDLTEAKDIKMWQEYTEELYKKDIHDPGGVIMMV